MEHPTAPEEETVIYRRVMLASGGWAALAVRVAMGRLTLDERRRLWDLEKLLIEYEQRTWSPSKD